MEIDNTMDQFEDWKSNRKLAITKLYEVAKALDAVEYNMHKAKIAGTATSIVFGIGSAAAGIVSIFTLGAALPVAIGLGVAASTGGVAVTGSVIYQKFKENTKLKDVQKILDKDIELTENLKTTFEKVMKAGEITLSFASKVNATVKLTAIVGQELLRNAGDDAVIAVGRVFGTVRDVTRIAGPIIGLAIVPFDVFTLVKSAIAVDKKTPSAVAEDIRIHALKMQKGLDAIEKKMLQKGENCYFDCDPVKG